MLIIWTKGFIVVSLKHTEARREKKRHDVATADDAKVTPPPLPASNSKFVRLLLLAGGTDDV